jgi:hypothetical protein
MKMGGGKVSSRSSRSNRRLYSFLFLFFFTNSSIFSLDLSK